MALPVLLYVILLASGNDYTLFQARYQSTDPQDGKALLGLGIWCEKEGHPAWGAICYRKVLQLGEGPSYPKAAYHLAKIEIGKGRYEVAFPLLHEIAAKYDYSQARDLLHSAESRATQRQRKHLAEGDRLLEGHSYKEALQEYVAAYELLPNERSSADFASESEVLRCIAYCRDLSDAEYYVQKVKPVMRSINDCGHCKAYGGFQKCPRCHGTGKVQKKIWDGRRWRTIWVTCGECGGHKWLVCKNCGGLEHTTDRLTRKEVKALRKLIQKTRDLDVLKKPLPRALKDIENTLLKLEDSPSLNYFRAVTANYSQSKHLREMLGSVPPSRAGLRAASQAWKNANKDVRERSNFLSSYACEFSHYLASFEMLRSRKRLLKVEALPTVENPPPRRVTPELLAAFPDEGSDGWIAVDGVFSGYQPSEELPHQGRLTIAADFPHQIHFFVWLPSARSELGWLQKSSWRRRIGDLPEHYPFDLHRKVGQIPADHQVTLVGRFLRDRLGFPRNWFEVWDLELGLHRSQEELLERLKEPLDIHFPGVEVKEVAGFLRWYGVDVRFAGIDEQQMVSIEAVDCPIGLILDALASALGAVWSFQEKQLWIQSTDRGRESPVVGTVLRRLQALGTGQVTASLTESPPDAPRKSTLAVAMVTDLPTLEKQASQAMALMRFEDALVCYDRLFALHSDAKEWSRLKKLIYQARLFYELTRHTPESRLGDADDLTHLLIRNPDGETFTITVQVVRRNDRHLWVQPSYGGEISFPSKWVVKEESLPGKEWRAQKKAELGNLIQKLDHGTSLERAHKLYMLALFCKSFRFTDRGTGFLKRAIGESEFPWLIETYLPNKKDSLLRYWHKATAREPEPEPPPPVKFTKTVKKPSAPKEPGVDLQELFDRAFQDYKKGREALSRSLPGMKDAQQQRRQALRYFESSLSFMEQILAQVDHHPDAEKRRSKLSLMIQTCVKDLGFFD